MENQELVSVIIPVYNREKYIERSILSVLGQTWKNLEIIVVDDCSSDQSVKKVMEMCRHYPNIHLIKNGERRGANGSRNAGIRISKADYIAFQDSDDEWYPEKLEKQMKVMKEQEADMVYCRVRRRHEGSDREYLFPKNKLNPERNITRQFLHSCMAMTPSILVRKKVYLDIPMNNFMLRFQEWDFNIRMSQKYRIAYVDEVLMEAHVLSDSVSNDMEMGLVYIQKLYGLHKELIDSYPEIHVEFLGRIARYKVGLGISAQKEFEEILSIRENLEDRRRYKLCANGKQEQLRKEYDSHK